MDAKNLGTSAIAKISFPKAEEVGPRPWGREIMLAHISKVLTLKRLEIKKGQKGGLQYHRLKNECGFVLSGKLLVRYIDDSGNLTETVLKKGDAFHFPPGEVHQEEAITDCVLIEASTPHFNDRVRVEKDFDLPEVGMPSTKLSEIEVK